MLGRALGRGPGEEGRGGGSGWVIYGVGVDIIEISRIEKAVARHGERFLNRVFTSEEIDYCWPEKHRYRRLAARFAAKEAVLKAIGIGLRQVRWTEINVRNGPLGKPEVELAGRLAEIASCRGVSRVMLSLSHGKDQAVAQALALAGGEIKDAFEAGEVPGR